MDESAGQVITTSVAEIINGFSFKEILRKVKGEKQTGAASDSYDDNYLGYSVAVGEFTGDSKQDVCETAAVFINYISLYSEELIAGVPRGARNFGYVAVINSSDLTFIQNFTGEQMASYFGYTIAVSDLNGDGAEAGCKLATLSTASKRLNTMQKSRAHLHSWF
ncbi:UNVERIFIED_CONTAM: hypothetical protein FKN15_039305 [Acipenser sinensis]